MHPPEAVGIECQQVVLNEAAILRSVLADDAEVVIVQPFGSVYGLSVPHVAAALLHDHIVRDFQTDQAIDDALTTLVMFFIGMECHDFVSEEARRMVAGVGDQRLYLGEFQPQCIAKELADAAFDRLGFVSGTAESEQPIIRIPDIPKPSEVGVFGTVAVT